MFPAGAGATIADQLVYGGYCNGAVRGGCQGALAELAVRGWRVGVARRLDEPGCLVRCPTEADVMASFLRL